MTRLTCEACFSVSPSLVVRPSTLFKDLLPRNDNAKFAKFAFGAFSKHDFAGVLNEIITE